MLMLPVILGWLLTAVWVVAVCVISQHGDLTRREGSQEPSPKPGSTGRLGW